MDFNEWLREQAHMDNAVGDLARDFVASGDTSLEGRHLGDGASRAYESALRQYQTVAVFA